MSDADTSSANPEALETFVNTAMHLDAQLTLGAVSLRGAIAEFTASCREYPTGIDESLADQLQDLARRNTELSMWVRRVADQFTQADTGQVDSPATQAAVQQPGTLVDAASSPGLGSIDGLSTTTLNAMVAADRSPASNVQALLDTLTPEQAAQLLALLGIARSNGGLAVADAQALASPAVSIGAQDAAVQDSGLAALLRIVIAELPPGAQTQVVALWGAGNIEAPLNVAGVLPAATSYEQSQNLWLDGLSAGARAFVPATSNGAPDAVLPPLTGADLGLSDEGLVGLLGAVKSPGASTDHPTTETTTQPVVGTPPWFSSPTSAAASGVSIEQVAADQVPMSEPETSPALSSTTYDDTVLGNRRVDPASAAAGGQQGLDLTALPGALGVGIARTSVNGMGVVDPGPGVLIDPEPEPLPPLTHPEPEPVPPAVHPEPEPLPPIVDEFPEQGGGVIADPEPPQMPSVAVSDDSSDNSGPPALADPIDVKFDIYVRLGDTPPRINVEANDSSFDQQGAHTLERHGPDIALRRADAPPGDKTVEGRIYGDPPWPNAENWSYRWTDTSTMNRTVNGYVQEHWETIRSELALGGDYSTVFDAGHAIGEGFYNQSVGTPDPRQAVYHLTSMVQIDFQLGSGDPPQVIIVRAYPLGRGSR